MPITDIFQINKIKAELEQTQKERDALKKVLAETEHLGLYELKQSIATLEEQKAGLDRELEIQKSKASRELTELEANFTKKRQSLEHQVEDLNQQIVIKKRDLIIFDDEILLQSFGFYKPQYDLVNSDAYKVRLEQVREKQTAMVKAGKAATCPTTWTVNNSQKEGERMIKDYTKLILRSFNNECDASIVNVKFNNVESVEKRIRKAYETLNSLAQRMKINITPEYLKLKMDELHLCYEYQVKRQEEKEELKRIREQMREEAKLQKEIEEAKLKIEKEEKHFNKALSSINERLASAQTEAERISLEQEKASVQLKLDQIEKNRADVQYREQNTRAGYVYVISNVGSFGEDIYKIGVTRRLDPEERVDELGDASVPFDFDIHAMIFSDDAPALENALHKAFEKCKVNMINSRREFFSVKLADIEDVIKNNYKKPVEFKRLAEAAEYRESLMLRRDGNGNAANNGHR
jgi:hypothetical protein